MAATLELKYFNSYWLKKISSVVDANPQPEKPYDTIPGGNANATPPVLPYANDNVTDWYIEESRIRGGYNNTSTDIGVKAHIVEDNPNNQNNTTAGEATTSSTTGSLSKQEACSVFDNNKVASILGVDAAALKSDDMSFGEKRSMLYWLFLIG